MKLEGILRQGGKNNQGVCDVVWHAILRSDWIEMKMANHDPSDALEAVDGLT